MNTVRRSGAGMNRRGDPVLMSQVIVEDEAGSGRAVSQRDVYEEFRSAQSSASSVWACAKILEIHW